MTAKYRIYARRLAPKSVVQNHIFGDIAVDFDRDDTRLGVCELHGPQVGHYVRVGETRIRITSITHTPLETEDGAIATIIGLVD